MASTYPLISTSSIPFTNSLVIAPSAIITIGITIPFMFHSFFLFSSKVYVLISLFTFFQFYPVVCLDGKVHYWQGLFSCWLSLGFVDLAKIRWSICISKSQRTFCISFSWMDSGLCIYHLFIWSNFLHNSQLITFPTLLSLVLYSFCANLLHSVIMSLIISSLSLHKLHLVFCWILFIFILT